MKDVECEHKGWHYLLPPDETGCIIVCKECDTLEFVPAGDMEDFKEQFPGIIVKPEAQLNIELTQAQFWESVFQIYTHYYVEKFCSREQLYKLLSEQFKITKI